MRRKRKKEIQRNGGEKGDRLKEKGERERGGELKTGGATKKKTPEKKKRKKQTNTKKTQKNTKKKNHKKENNNQKKKGLEVGPYSRIL